MVKHGLLRLSEDDGYTEQVNFLIFFFIDCQLNLQRQVNFFCSNSFYLRKVWSIRDQVVTSVLIELIRLR